MTEKLRSSKVCAINFFRQANTIIDLLLWANPNRSEKQGRTVRLAGLLAFLLLSNSEDLWARPIPAGSCSNTDVANAIAAAADGDTVLIPSGNCTWSSTVSIPNKSISVIGAGASTTTIQGTVPLLNVTTKSTGNTPPGFTRISGITWKTNPGTSGCATYDIGTITISGSSGNVRVDNGVVDHTNCGGIVFRGYVRGVVDHNIFFLRTGLTHSLATGHKNWAGVGEYGDNSWAVPSTQGTPETLTYEDNVFNCSAPYDQCYATDDNHGSRTVIRFNTFNNTYYATHGLETNGRPRGYRHCEAYRNKFVFTGPSFPGFIGLRGGTCMVFENVLTGNASHLASVNTYRRSETTLTAGRGQYPFGKCGKFPVTLTRSGSTVVATGNHYFYIASGINVGYVQISGAVPADFNGVYKVKYLSPTQFSYTSNGTLGLAGGAPVASSPIDGNTDNTGYPCADQGGRGAGVLIAGDGPQDSFVPVNPLGPLNQQSEPIVAWGNIRNGALDPLIVFDAPTNDVVVANRDFYNQDPSCTGSSCTTGVGVGTSLPSSCMPRTTPGPYFWKTDTGTWNTSTTETYSSTPGADGVLYRCTATNTWAATYTPLIYPHYLVNLATGSSTPPSAPTGLRVQ